MQKLSLLSLSILFLFFSCSKSSSDVPEETESEQPDQEDNVVEEEVYFTVNVGENHFNSDSEGWVVGHDVNNGDIISYARLENGAVTTLKKPTSSTSPDHNISLIHISHYGGNTHYRISSYVFIKSGEVWKLGSQNGDYVSPRGDVIGEITINADNLVSPGSWIISNKHGSTLSGGSQVTTMDNLTSIFFENIPLFEENKYLFSVYDTYGKVKYLFIDNLNDGDNVTFDGTQLQSFDKTILVSAPEGGEYFASVYGFEENQEFDEGGGYILAMFFPFDNDKITTDYINLGYLNTFNKYITTYTYSKDRFHFNFKKYGEAALGIPMSNMDNWNVKVIDDSVDNFIYEGVSYNQFSRQGHFWGVSSGNRNVDYIETSWSINQGKFYYTFEFKLPEEILTAYPEMDIEGLNYESSFFHLDNYDYYQFLNASFVDLNPEMLRDRTFYRIDSE
ncbi:hypothetical protein D2V93_14245 [Flagellimonas taeanensis]|uniref:hypothetical protein n=1 Tax=Flavobacteriaceae TaxID=49546 RepID=UPI000E69E757|nr:MULTISPECIES: hypothetical protein [Allomuricauda]MDC6385057.1 hypothetical protein [Muricauda sp. SK9]RIV48976.1 hypothetical protein D2V93_14245 [Allomuricauda taeanensis]